MAGKFYLNNNNLTVTGGVAVFDYDTQWIVTNGIGSLYQTVGTGNKDFYLGTEDSRITVTLARPSGDNLIGVSVYEGVNSNGQVNGEPILGIQDTAGFTIAIDAPTGQLNLIGGDGNTEWDPALNGSNYATAPSGTFNSYTGGTWTTDPGSYGLTTTSSGNTTFTGDAALSPASPLSVVPTLPGADFKPYVFEGLNGFQEHDYDGGVAPIEYPPPYNPYNGFFFYEEGSLDSLTRYEWLPGIITDPTRMDQLNIPGLGGEFGFFPFSGTWFNNYDQWEMISIDGGTFHGMPNGEYSFPNNGGGSQGPDVPVLPEILEEEEEWLEDFMGLAHVNVNELFNKHEICKSDLDRMLDALVNAG